MLKVHEIFSTIQGEGYDTGIPCTCVRLFGCNVKCSYCDQPQCKSDLKRMSVERVFDEIRKLRIKNICITGGEPLIQEEVYSLIYELVANGYAVSIETNGTVEIPDTMRRSYKYVMDVKCPSSGVHTHNYYRNLAILHPSDEVKFVIADEEDYKFMKIVLQKYPTKAKVLVSPMFDPNQKQTIGKDLCNWVIRDRLNVRIQIQMHKILGVL